MTFQILMGLIQRGRITIKRNGKPAMQSTAWRRGQWRICGRMKCAAHERRTNAEGVQETWLLAAGTAAKKRAYTAGVVYRTLGEIARKFLYETYIDKRKTI